jgi:hypothetical protein
VEYRLGPADHLDPHPAAVVGDRAIGGEQCPIAHIEAHDREREHAARDPLAVLVEQGEVDHLAAAGEDAQRITAGPDAPARFVRGRAGIRRLVPATGRQRQYHQRQHFQSGDAHGPTHFLAQLLSAPGLESPHPGA